MKIWLSLLFLASLVQVGSAVPLRLHNRIVFTRGNWVQGVETVWTMNADGSNQKRIWRVPKGYGQFGGFSRDGGWALSYNQFNLYVHDLSTKRMHQVLFWNIGWGTYINHPSFSPNGKQVLCEVGNGFQDQANANVLLLQTKQVYGVASKVKPQDFRPIRPDVPPSNQWSAPRWSADGQKIILLGGPQYSASQYYSRPQTSAPEIWLSNADGTGAQQITHNLNWEELPDLNYDESKIVFTRQPDPNQIDIQDGAANIWLADLISHTERQVTFFPDTFSAREYHNQFVVLGNPLFSPKGTQIVFQERGRNFEDIYLLNTDRSQPKRLGSGHLIQWIP